MDTDENFKLQALETGFDIEKRNRRSSILKPRKSGTCLIDETNKTNTNETNTEVFTSGKASRRVSFANINFIKPFASDPEKTTIWDNTYEEEVNHSDSTKSVDTVCPGMLNTTSISFPEFEDIEPPGKSPFQIWESASSSEYIQYEIAQGVKECDKENVIPLVQKVVSKNETIIFGSTDSDIEFTGTYENVNFKVPKSIVEFVKNRPSQNKSVASNGTDFEMELTCLLPKSKNFKASETSCETISKTPNEAKNATICSPDDMEFTLTTNNSFSSNMEFTTIVGHVKSSNIEPCFDNKEKNVQLSQNNIAGRIDFANAEQLDDMEFTTNLCDVKRGLQDHKVLDPNIPEAEMEFTCNLTNFKPFLTCEQATTKEKIEPVVGNYSEETDMEFTSNLAVPQYFPGTTDLSKQPSVDIGSDDQMEYTSNLPNIKQIFGRLDSATEYFSDTSMLKPQQSLVSKIIQASTEKIPEEIDMEFTAILAKPKYFSSTIQTTTDKTCRSNQLEKNEHQDQLTTNLAAHKFYSDGIQTDTAEIVHNKQLEKREPEALIKCTTHSKNVKEVCNHPRQHNTEEIDMEFTSNLGIYKQSSNAVPPVMARSILYNRMFVEDKSEDMECTTIVPNAKQICNNFHDLPSGNTSQGHHAETIQTTLVNQSEGVDEKFTISSGASKKLLKSTSSNQQFGELKSEDIKQVHNSSKEMYSNLESSPTVVGQTVEGNEYRALGTKFPGVSTTSKEVLGVVETTTAEVMVLPSRSLDRSSKGPKIDKSTVHTTVEKNKDNTAEVLAIQNHKQVEDNVIEEFTNREVNNILYSEHGNLLLKHDEFLPISGKNTPTTSFAMNFSNMSPCIEDTQQLIHATFSKPESIDVLLKGRKQMKNKSESKDSKAIISQLNDTCDNFKQTFPISAECDQDLKTNKTCWDLENSISDILSNETPEIVAVDESISLEEEALKNRENSSAKMEPDSEVSLESSRDSLDYQNYTMRSNRILNNIKKHLVCMQPDPFFEESIKRCEKVCAQSLDYKERIKSFFENNRLPKIKVIDLEDFFKEDSEDTSTSRMSEGLSTDEADGQNRLSVPNLDPPKSLYERVCEAAERSGKYWRFVKSENDFYHFDALFRAIYFKAHIHPELGMVYSIETCNKLADESLPIAHYAAKVLELKMKKRENLLVALGPNFDVFSLLDYVCLCIDGIFSFHKEFDELLDKYGSSHKLTFHPDNRVTFEILHFRFIIWWIITIDMSVNSIGCKECVSAKYNLKEKVKEEEIKQIAENCPKGVNFLRCFLEKVDEYVQRIGRRIEWQRQSRLRQVHL